MNKWKMLTLIGEDQVGIVSAVTKILEENGFNLGETSMTRLAGNFTIMMMARSTSQELFSDEKLRVKFESVLEKFSLTLHIDNLNKHQYEHIVPEINIAIHGANRIGIVADVTEVLKNLEFNILDLYSDTGGKKDSFYILNIEGSCQSSVDKIKSNITQKLGDDIKVVVSTIQTMIG